MNVINLQSSTGELYSIIKPCGQSAKSKEIFRNIFLFQITTLITLFVMTDQPFLFSDSNFEASCVHVDLSKTATWIIIFTNGVYTFATLFIENCLSKNVTRKTLNRMCISYLWPWNSSFSTSLSCSCVNKLHFLCYLYKSVGDCFCAGFKERPPRHEDKFTCCCFFFLKTQPHDSVIKRKIGTAKLSFTNLVHKW